jgi:tetratricopeptide (TPR) repeat protein
LCIAAAIAAALTAGGCSVPGAQSPAWRSPTTDVAMEQPAVPPAAVPFDEAVGLVSQLKYPEAEIKFRRSLVWFQAAGDKDRSAECLFWIGFCQEKQGRTAEARGQYEKSFRDYPGTPAARLAAERMGRLPAEPAPLPPRNRRG